MALSPPAVTTAQTGESNDVGEDKDRAWEESETEKGDEMEETLMAVEKDTLCV